MPRSFREIEYRYHGVGQGLFASGALFVRERGRGFRWVYDCGTTSNQQLVKDEIDGLSRSAGGRLGLVAVSHFDKDHISGLAELLSKFEVEILLLPYAPLVSRMAAAFAQGIGASDRLIELFVDPVGYIRRLEGGERIGRIILVPPSDGDSAPPPPEEGEGPETGEGGLELDADTEKSDPAIAGDPIFVAATPDDRAVETLRQGGRLRLGRLWEFVPYNNGEVRRLGLAKFGARVDGLREHLLETARRWRAGEPMEARVTKAIDNLKRYYDRTFGKTAKPRNLISLFLYSGPIQPPPLRSRYIWDGAWLNSCRAPGAFSERIAQLFSGDGYLDTPARLDALERFLSRQRLDRVGLFQVMHHGARANWHKGVAVKLGIPISIFCSDPRRGSTYHPHQEVLRDFWAYKPIQVNRASLTVLFYGDGP